MLGVLLELVVGSVMTGDVMSGYLVTVRSVAWIVASLVAVDYSWM